MDLHKSKMEKEHRGETASKKGLLTKLEASAQQQSSITDAITALEKQILEVETLFHNQKRDFEHGLISLKAEALLLNSSVEEIRVRRDALRQRCDSVVDDRQKIEFELKKIGQGNATSEQQRRLEQQWRGLQQRHREVSFLSFSFLSF